jgi:RNA polymerase sigma factor (sigma-70 family)
LVGTWEGRLLYFIRRLVHDEADAWDVLQKTWLRVLKGIASLNEPQSLATWLYCIARNTALTYNRSRGELPESLDDSLDARAGPADSLPIERPQREDLKFILAFFLLTALAFLVIAWVLFRAYWKGVVDRRGSNGWAGRAGIAYVGLLGWLFLLMSQYIPERLRDDVRVFGLVLLIYAAVAWVRHRVAQAESRTAEKLLEIELRLAEIGEAAEARLRLIESTPPARPPSA